MDFSSVSPETAFSHTPPVTPSFGMGLSPGSARYIGSKRSSSAFMPSSRISPLTGSMNSPPLKRPAIWPLTSAVPRPQRLSKIR